MRRIVAIGLTMVFALAVTACGGGSDTIRLVSADDAAEVFADQPEGMVVLDIRTPQEYAAGHLEGAVLIDFYESNFQAQLAELDRDTPYLMYCNSGNRSGQAREMMEDLGFTDVRDIDGGIQAWAGAGHPLVA